MFLYSCSKAALTSAKGTVQDSPSSTQTVISLPWPTYRTSIPYRNPTSCSATPAAMRTRRPSSRSSSNRLSRSSTSRLFSDRGMDLAKSIRTGDTNVPNAERTLAFTGKTT